MYLIYDTALLKPRREQVCELQSAVVSGGRFILLWAWYTVAVTLSRVAMSGFTKFIHSLEKRNHMGLTAKKKKKKPRVGGVLPKFNFPSNLSHTDCTQHPPTQISTQNVAWSVWIAFCLVYNKSNSCKAVLALSYVFAHFCWLKSHFLLGKLLTKVYFLHSCKLLA